VHHRQSTHIRISALDMYLLLHGDGGGGHHCPFPCPPASALKGQWVVLCVGPWAPAFLVAFCPAQLWHNWWSVVAMIRHVLVVLLILDTRWVKFLVYVPDWCFMLAGQCTCSTFLTQNKRTPSGKHFEAFGGQCHAGTSPKSDSSRHFTADLVLLDRSILCLSASLAATFLKSPIYLHVHRMMHEQRVRLAGLVASLMLMCVMTSSCWSLARSTELFMMS
jgi:hypothetical protein